MWNIKALALTVQKLVARLKFEREWQTDRQDKNNMPPIFEFGGIKIHSALGNTSSYMVFHYRVHYLKLHVYKLKFNWIKIFIQLSLYLTSSFYFLTYFVIRLHRKTPTLTIWITTSFRCRIVCILILALQYSWSVLFHSLFISYSCSIYI